MTKRKQSFTTSKTKSKKEVQYYENALFFAIRTFGAGTSSKQREEQRKETVTDFLMQQVT